MNVKSIPKAENNKTTRKLSPNYRNENSIIHQQWANPLKPPQLGSFNDPMKQIHNQLKLDWNNYNGSEIVAIVDNFDSKMEKVWKVRFFTETLENESEKL